MATTEVDTKELNVVSQDTGRGTAFRVAILFGVGSSKLTAGQISFLSEVVVPIVNDPASPFEMFGITSKSGSNQFNLDLSDRRLEGVKNQLMLLGVAIEDINRPPNSGGFILGETFADEFDKKGPEEDARLRAVVIYLWPDDLARRTVFADSPLLIFARKRFPGL